MYVNTIIKHRPGFAKVSEGLFSDIREQAPDAFRKIVRA